MIQHFKSEEYTWLSNFEPCTIIIDGIKYPSVEHAYVSAKCDTTEWKTFCSTELNPAKIKKEGRLLNTLPINWDTLKIDIMRVCIDQKYDQSPYKEKLIATGNKYIQEGNWWKDTFWGVDLKANPPYGNNMLGKLIMEKRYSLITEGIF